MMTEWIGDGVRLELQTDLDNIKRRYAEANANISGTTNENGRVVPTGRPSLQWLPR